MDYSIKICYNITLHSRDLFILELIKSHFGGVGNISVQQISNRCSYEIKSLKDIIKYILPHFYQYPLISNKLADYTLFKEIVLIMQDKGHFTESGLQEIVNRRATLNFGLSDTLKKEFPFTKPVSRPIIPEPKIPHPY